MTVSGCAASALRDMPRDCIHEADRLSGAQHSYVGGSGGVDGTRPIHLFLRGRKPSNTLPTAR